MVKTAGHLLCNPRITLPNITPLRVLENVQQSIETYSYDCDHLESWELFYQSPMNGGGCVPPYNLTQVRWMTSLPGTHARTHTQTVRHL